MNRFRGWLAAVLVLCVAAVCIRLGFWQLDRLQQRRATNAMVATARTLPPLEIDSAGVDSILSDPHKFQYRRAVVSGSYEPGEILLRGRVFQGQPGVHLVVPMRTRTGALLLVNRGWLPSPDAATADPRPYRQSGVQRVEGLLMEVPRIPSGGTPAPATLPDTGFSTFQRLDLETLAVMFDESPLGMYLQVTPSEPPGAVPDYPVAVAEPELGEGPHLSYAFQWFAFATIAVVGFVIVLIRSRGKPRS